MSGPAVVDRSRRADPARRRAGERRARAGHEQALREEELAPTVAPRAPAERREERPRPGAAEAPAGAGGGRLTFGEVLAGAWEDLLAAGCAPCLVCGGRMERHGAAGRCPRCGSSLS